MITIRTCEEQDYVSIHSLNHDLGYDYPIEKTREQLLKILKRPTDKLFIACLDGQTAGYIQVSDYECLYSDSMKNIMGLVVDHNCQHQGVGRALLSAAEEWAREQGSAGVRLNSAMRRAGAHAFYERCGYYHQKDQKNYIKLFAANED